MQTQASASNAVPHPRSITGFCHRYGFCVATFYNLAKRNSAPRVLKLGSRSIVTEEAEAEWLRKMQSTATA